MNRIAFVLGAVALALSSAACAAPADGDGSESNADALMSGGGGTGAGYVCGLNQCSCDPNSSEPDESCLGLEQMCKKLGGILTTKPSGAKECVWAITTPPTSPLPAPQRTGATRLAL